ncbi:hypothetical protein [Rhodanobacter geophilus]|uniref:DUF4942 domain-containing protein n=1 Tax=Rhodanobacter geophilus TaxID=3162488 RepID=A0ABV3QSQ9_9GAMM
MLVRADRVICPVSDAVYVETMQATDRQTRLATASLLDELSQGICLRTEYERVTMELADFMRSPSGEGSLVSDLAWVRPGMVFGARTPSSPAFDELANRAFQKSAIDHMWAVSFRDLVGPDGDGDLANVMQASASRINEKMVEYAPTIQSFQQAFAAEVSGAIKFFDEKAARDFLASHLSEFSLDDVEKCQSSMQTMLFNVFRLRPELMAKRVPSLYVHAACHAAVRWDKTRKLDGHWLMDIHHASAACGHHHAMFTEKPLRVLMTSGHLRLHEKFGMQVIAEGGEALRYLSDLQSAERAAM